MEENKLITSHWITAHESGIITLIINTVDRWVGFHRYNDNWYIVEDEDGNVEHLRIELPLQEKMRYMSSSSQNKDEITFYYIPYPLVMEKNKWDKIKERL